MSSVQSSDDVSHFALGTTVDTDVSILDGNVKPFDHNDHVIKRANEYERDVQRENEGVFKPPIDRDSHSSVLQTPIASKTNNGSTLLTGKHSNDTSPFDHLHSDLDEENVSIEGSLELSQSADMFGTGTNLDVSPIVGNNN